MVTIMEAVYRWVQITSWVSLALAAVAVGIARIREGRVR